MMDFGNDMRVVISDHVYWISCSFMSQQIINVRARRRQWLFKQDQLAELLGMSQSLVSRIEQGEALPDVQALIGLQVIFGSSPRGLFPSLYQTVEETVMARAAELDRKLARDKPQTTRHQRRLLTAMTLRATEIERKPV